MILIKTWISNISITIITTKGMRNLFDNFETKNETTNRKEFRPKFEV